MKTIKYSCFFVVLLFSCNNTNEKSGSNTENKNAAITKPRPAIQHVLLSNSKTHYFSDGSKKDTFKILLTGDSLRTAKAIFSITSCEGIRIYADTFSGDDLTMNVDGDPVIPNSEKLANIKKSVKGFFNEKKFSEPPFFEEDGNPADEWNELKSDKSAIGFEVAMNHKDFRIAYFKKRRQVLSYWDDDMAGD